MKGQNDAEEYIHARIPIEWKKQIQDLVEKGLYKDMTAFLHEAIRNQLDPDRQQERIRKKILELARSDPEVKKEFNL
jgi:Arc/MetJ-type ribon-helix-helix transcriptional regulator